MDIKWLEDYVALIEEGTFTKAAEKRFVTQPAFSRRIRSLENWFGSKLLDRNAFPVKLTPLGEELKEPIKQLLDDIYTLRRNTQALEARSHIPILSTQASLSISFGPTWFREIQPILDDASIRVIAGDLFDSLELFLAGHSDMLMCYSQAELIPSLDRTDLRKLHLSTDRLVPVYKIGAEHHILKEIDGVLNYVTVSFPPDSFFGELIQKYCMSHLKPEDGNFHCVYETALSESVHAHVLCGTGMAWLPESLVREDLKDNRLTIIDELPTLPLEIIFLTHTENISNPIANRIWDYLYDKYNN